MILKLPKKNIETDRLVLQPYHIKYYKDVYILISKNKPRLIHSFPKLLMANESLEETKEFIQQKVFDWNNNRAYAYMLFNKETTLLIGHFNIKDIDWKKRQTELSYFIDENYEKKGLATEALEIVLKVCFLALKFNRVFVRIVTTNIASQKVVEKAKLKYEGTFYQDYTTYDNKIVDTYRYGISKEDYTRN